MNVEQWGLIIIKLLYSKFTYRNVTIVKYYTTVLYCTVYCRRLHQRLPNPTIPSAKYGLNCTSDVL